MSKEIIIDANYWQGDGEAVITTWYFEEGDRVSQGDVIAELMLEKVQMEIDAPETGTLRIKMPAEEPVKKGDIIAVIEMPGE